MEKVIRNKIKNIPFIVTWWILSPYWFIIVLFVWIINDKSFVNTYKDLRNLCKGNKQEVD